MEETHMARTKQNAKILFSGALKPNPTGTVLFPRRESWLLRPRQNGRVLQISKDELRRHLSAIPDDVKADFYTPSTVLRRLAHDQDDVSPQGTIRFIKFREHMAMLAMGKNPIGKTPPPQVVVRRAIASLGCDPNEVHLLGELKED